MLCLGGICVVPGSFEIEREKSTLKSQGIPKCQLHLKLNYFAAHFPTPPPPF